MSLRQRPVIGVTGPVRGGATQWLFTRLALWRAGARARRVTSAHHVDPAELDGLVIGGGADVTEPATAEDLEQPPPSTHVRWPRRAADVVLAPLVLMVRLIGAVKPQHGVDPARDVLEARLIRYADRHGLPVLGICRGAQLMNLVAGGTLLRDVDSMYTERPQLYTVLPRRAVEVAEHSRLHAVVGRKTLLVNSLHHHAVDTPGPGLQVVAREPSGVPQAVERPQRDFWLGVQWHPEYLPQQKAHQQLFQALARSASAVRVAREAARAHAADEGISGAPRP
jgi:putative glutamine amidotransferase